MRRMDRNEAVHLVRTVSTVVDTITHLDARDAPVVPAGELLGHADCPGGPEQELDTRKERGGWDKVKQEELEEQD